MRLKLSPTKPLTSAIAIALHGTQQLIGPFFVLEIFVGCLLIGALQQMLCTKFYTQTLKGTNILHLASQSKTKKFKKINDENLSKVPSAIARQLELPQVDFLMTFQQTQMVSVTTTSAQLNQ